MQSYFPPEGEHAGQDDATIHKQINLAEGDAGFALNDSADHTGACGRTSGAINDTGADAGDDTAIDGAEDGRAVIQGHDVARPKKGNGGRQRAGHEPEDRRVPLFEEQVVPQPFLDRDRDTAGVFYVE